MEWTPQHDGALVDEVSQNRRGHQKEAKFGTPSLQPSMLWNTRNLRSSRAHVEIAEEEGERRLQKKFEEKPWNVWEKVAKDVGKMERWK